jgi:Peptidase family M23
MKALVALLPVLIAFQAGAPPALAWTWPVDGPVLRPFALGDDPYAAGQHRGIDVAAAPGSPVRAPAGGTVRFAGTVPGGGRTVTLLTEDGYAVTLLHLGAIAVARSAPVAEGATVGTIGPSGDAEHEQGYVHLGVRVAEDPNGYLDPLAFLPAREVAPPPAPDPSDDPEPRAEPAPAPAPVTAPAPVPGEEAPVTPAVPPAPPDDPALVPAAETSGRGERSAPPEVPAVAVHGPTQTQTPSARGRAPRGVGAAPAEAGGGPGLPARTAKRVLELAIVPDSPTSPATAREARDSRAGRGEGPPRFSLAAVALGALAALIALVVALRRLGGRQLGDARRAYAAAPVLADATRGPAEDARGSRAAEEDRLIPNRDLEWIPLRESEALADLDRDDDPAQLVEVPDDACRRLPATVVANLRAHRVRRHQPSRCRRPERLVAR